MRGACAAAALVLAGCGGEAQQAPEAGAGGARQEPYAAVPPGSVPIGSADRLALMKQGPPVTPALLRAGGRAYADACAACHGMSGWGDGPVVENGFPRPAPLALTPHPPEEIVAIITEGRGQMPALAVQVPPAERWAIARWLEARRQGGGRGD